MLFPLYIVNFRCVTGLSDVSVATLQPVITADMHRSLVSLRQRARGLRVETGLLRKTQLQNTESIKEAVNDTFLKIKVTERDGGGWDGKGEKNVDACKP